MRKESSLLEGQDIFFVLTFYSKGPQPLAHLSAPGHNMAETSEQVKPHLQNTGSM